MSQIVSTIRCAFAALVAAALPLAADPARAQQAVEVQVTYANGAFQPGELRAPADRPVVVRVKNLDGKAMEFESKSLRVEKVVAAKSEGVINVRPLKPGRYEFFDDFDQKARGTLTVQ
jgi:heme/copper-type cytochrome/quinol oxidase subunit 2